MSSSTSSEYEGLQSCHVEPRVMRMKLAPVSHSQKPKTDSETPTLHLFNTIHESDMKQNKPIGDKEGWSILQSLYNKTHKPDTENVYVHPTVKRSSSVLSQKSLEMCTESLGCETGSDGSASSDDIALFSLETKQRHASESNRICVSKRSNLRSASKFPPPLSSMSESGGVQVRPRREDGRLILEAVPTLFPLSYFRAERSNGRLTLRLLNTFRSSYCDEDDEEAVEEEEAEAEAEEEEDADEEEEEKEELDENYENVEDETGMRKVSRPSRCNETGNSSTQMLDWEPFWLAT